jgi:tyrosine-protein kinase Etk/Wzc
VPPSQLPLYKLLTVLVGFLLGGFITSLVIVIKNLWTKVVEDAEQLERETHLPVHAVIPFSRKQKQMEKMYQRSLNTLGTGISSKPLVLAKQEPNDITIESIRSLNIALLMMTNTVNHHLIAVMGSVGNTGKSFVSMNLAQVIADTGKRTLLIDADVRKGHLHQTFLQPKEHGLSEYLEGQCTDASIIRKIDNNLSFISCGVSTKHPIELFKNTLFEALLQKVKQEFDQVIIDTPPVIPVIDSLLITKFCDIKLFVVNSSKDTITDVKQSIKKAHTHGIKINGFILNHRRPLAPYGINIDKKYAYSDTLQSATSA